MERDLIAFLFYHRLFEQESRKEKRERERDETTWQNRAWNQNFYDTQNKNLQLISVSLLNFNLRGIKNIPSRRIYIVQY